MRPHCSSSSRPSGGSISTVAVDRQQLTAWGVQNLGDDADIAAGGRTHSQTFKLVVVVGVRLVDGRQLRGVDDEHAAPQRVGGIAIGHPRQPHQQAAAVSTGRLDGVAALTMIRSLGA
jgi:hypothetical protein